MSENKNVHDNVSVATKLLATGAATLALLGAGEARAAEPARPIDGTVVHDPNIVSDSLPAIVIPEGQGRNFNQTRNSLPEPEPITPEIFSIMEREVVRIPALGCSGFLVRNDEGDAIGFMTAEHCGLKAGRHERVMGTDDKTYMVFPSPVVAQTGDTPDGMEDIGTVAEFAVWPENDYSNDLALAAFEGYTTTEVMEYYRHYTTNQLANLPQGTTINMAGYPSVQPGSNGQLNRQEYSMSALGLTNATTNMGETIEVFVAAVKANGDDAICSNGTSGSEGFTTTLSESDLEVPVSVGTLSIFNDFRGITYGTPESGEASREYMSNKFSVDLSDYDAICGFAFELPTQENGGVPITVVDSYVRVPGYLETLSPHARLAAETREYFYEEGTVHHVLSGAAYIEVVKGGATSSTGILVENPIILYDPETRVAGVARRDPEYGDGLAILIVDRLADIKIFEIGGEPNTINDFTGVPEPVIIEEGSGYSYGFQFDGTEEVIGVAHSSSNFGGGLTAGDSIIANRNGDLHIGVRPYERPAN